jgi:hypothetical protein
MRCSCCNRNLSDWETTAKHAETGAYLDTCTGCLKGSGIPVDSRKDLDPHDAVEEDEWYGDDEEQEE